MNVGRLGIDVGSTTVKVVVLDEDGSTVFSEYERHNARIAETLLGILNRLDEEREFHVGITGSIGMGIAQRAGLHFVQEVIAAAKATKARCNSRISTLIDIGGEDAKVVFFNEKGEPIDLRMNGNCAAGTGSFLDQMAVILGEPLENLSRLAEKADHVYPIASRCGVFCKTDIQNLVAKNVSKENIAASIFHAVAVQTVVTLAHGYDMTPPILFCGGPLTFTPALREEFIKYLNLKDGDVIVHEEGRFFPAIGAAIDADMEQTLSIGTLKRLIANSFTEKINSKDLLQPIFKDENEYAEWKSRVSNQKILDAPLRKGRMDLFLGIDSGSTTTKVVFTDKAGRMVFNYYAPNLGDPVGTASKGLQKFKEECVKNGTEANIIGSCSTGYGEDLIKAAFRLDSGIIETIAHYIAARHIDPQVSFILDIGGQDMKAIYVDKGVINRIEINEACSSGCGSFLETFANSLNYSVGDFAKAACSSQHPCDLGTRCTVFMNSKVKQVLREGFSAPDIAAGLAYSVVKNCLYKVLKLKNTTSLGNHIVVQGGTMRNDAVVKALENLTGAKVSRSQAPELMGAYGCALYSKYALENNIVATEAVAV
jgi:predicted CoA-substrate-specific enzyme activase